MPVACRVVASVAVERREPRSKKRCALHRGQQVELVHVGVDLLLLVHRPTWVLLDVKVRDVLRGNERQGRGVAVLASRPVPGAR